MFFKNFITIKNISFLIAALFILYFLAQIKGITLLFFASYVIACSLNPVVNVLSKKMNRYAATTIVLFITLTVSTAFFVPIILVAIKQVQGLLTVLPEQLDAIQNFIVNHRFYGYSIPDMVNFDSLLKTTSPFATGIVNQSINITIGFAQGIMYFLAICMIVFYILSDKNEIKAGFIRFFPDNMKAKAASITGTISTKVGGYVIAQLLNMVAIGILTAIALFIVKVDYALLLGVITGVLDIIPIIGPTIALILCVITGYNLGPIGMALIVVAFLVAQWVSNNLVRPVVFGKFLDLHPLIIIFAILVAAQFLGVWGVILAPAIASMVCVLFDELYLKPVNRDR